LPSGWECEAPAALKRQRISNCCNARRIFWTASRRRGTTRQSLSLFTCSRAEMASMKRLLAWLGARRRRCTGTRLALGHREDRIALAALSAPAILQFFDATYQTIENRLPALFNAGYGQLLTPPPGRADSGNQSVGYDVYNRFDLGGP